MGFFDIFEVSLDLGQSDQIFSQELCIIYSMCGCGCLLWCSLAEILTLFPCGWRHVALYGCKLLHLVNKYRTNSGTTKPVSVFISNMDLQQKKTGLGQVTYKERSSLSTHCTSE